MHGSFIIIAFVTLILLTGSACFEFFITRDLNSSKVLEKSKFAHVDVTTDEFSVSVTFDIPVALSYSDPLIFFANDHKNILQVNFNKTVQGKFYEVPYQLKKEMNEKNEITKVENEDSHQISGIFPRSWLPKECNKVNAAVVSTDGRYYNYYKIQNFEISLPDLMVVEEYKNCELD